LEQLSAVSLSRSSSKLICQVTDIVYIVLSQLLWVLEDGVW